MFLQAFMDEGVADGAFQAKDWDVTQLPDHDVDFISKADLDAFEKALAAPTTTPVTALNDWKPIHQRVRRSRSRKAGGRNKDETREGFVYALVRYPLLLLVLGWIVFLFIVYNLTRLYIYLYERSVSVRGRKTELRRHLQRANTYGEWKAAAIQLDTYLGNEDWKESAAYSYYNHQTVAKVLTELTELRQQIQNQNQSNGHTVNSLPVQELKALLESCIKNNFVGVENPRLYSETYYGTKTLVQRFVDEVAQGLRVILESSQITQREKLEFFRHLELNYGRTALCLSGGATFAYYHFGVIKALLDAKQLPDIITGTSGGALVAALVGTRTDEELKHLLVPALAYRIRACHDSFSVWFKRWRKTGARFDSTDWALQCSWFCRGSMTFREAYQRTGRILNVSCVPSSPHSPTMLNNHITSPDCVIWTAVLASAAVPGILNPIVLMRKNRDGSLSPYSFGHKWKDGSLRTDIPLKALNIHFNVNFSIVSQVNPHINLFFFSPRGSPGKPVTHRRGRGWRGGFLGSSIETTVKLDLQKYLKILRHLELLPRPLGQDWSEIWLQRFSGNVTIWPKSVVSDYWNILSDPSTKRLARMIKVGERSCWPRLVFITNRLKVEKIILEGLRRNRPAGSGVTTPTPAQEQTQADMLLQAANKRMEMAAKGHDTDEAESDLDIAPETPRRQSTLLEEIGRQATVFWQDDPHTDLEEEVLSNEEDERPDKTFIMRRVKSE